MMANNITNNPYGGFHKWGIPNSWMVDFMENPMKVIENGWFGGTPILGNLYISDKLRWYPQQPQRFIFTNLSEAFA